MNAARKYQKRIDTALRLLDKAEQLGILDDGRPRGDEHWTRKEPERVTKGEAHKQAKLTEEDVVVMRREAARGVTYRALATRYNVSPRTAWMAATGRTWKHVPLEQASPDPLLNHLTRTAARAQEHRCAGCGRTPAAGLASINDRRYCHGDLDASPTCYERAVTGE